MRRELLPHILCLQVFAIILVVLGHSAPAKDLDQVPLLFLWTRDLVYSFHMPLFFSISGFLFAYSHEKGDFHYADFMRRRVLRLLLPYVVLTSVAFLVKSAFSQYAWRTIDFSIGGYVRSLVVPSENPIIYYWFQPTLFAVSLTAPMGRKALLSGKAGTAVFLFLSSLLYLLDPLDLDLFNLRGFDDYLVYFALGIAIFRFWRELSRLFMRKGSMAGMLALLITGSMIDGGTNGRLSDLATATVGILFSFALSVHLKRGPLIRYVNGYPYQIFLLSWFFSTGVRVAAAMIGVQNPWMIITTKFLAALALPVLVARLVDRNFTFLRPALGIASREESG